MGLIFPIIPKISSLRGIQRGLRSAQLMPIAGSIGVWLGCMAAIARTIRAILPPGSPGADRRGPRQRPAHRVTIRFASERSDLIIPSGTRSSVGCERIHRSESSSSNRRPSFRPGREGRVMGQGNPARGKAPMGWALRLGILGALTAAVGCDSGTSSSGGAPRQGRLPYSADRRESLACGRRRPDRQAGRDRDRGRPDDEVRPGGDEQADRVEPVPLRRDRQGGRDRFHALLGHDRGEALPDRQRLGGRRVRLRQRRPARHLFRQRHAPAAGHRREWPQPTVQEPGEQPVPGRDREVGPRPSRLLPRDHRRRHRQ